MWTSENRARYDRSGLRYPSDLTDGEWALIEPLIPPAKRGGGKRSVDMRAVVNGLMYVLSTGCQWRAIPRTWRRAPRFTTISTFGTTTGHWSGSITRSSCLVASRRIGQPANGGDHRQPEREERGKRGRAIDPPGYDAGKKIRGKKRHLLVDTQAC